MSTKKSAGGRANQGTPRKGRRLGVKLYGGQKVSTGQIIITQAGSSYKNGNGVKRGRDFTLFSLKEGTVNFKTNKGKKVVEVI